MADQLRISLAGDVRTVPILSALPAILRGPASEGSIRDMFKLEAKAKFHLEDESGARVDVCTVENNSLVTLVLDGDSANSSRVSETSVVSLPGAADDLSVTISLPELADSTAPAYPDSQPDTPSLEAGEFDLSSLSAAMELGGLKSGRSSNRSSLGMLSDVEEAWDKMRASMEVTATDEADSLLGEASTQAPSTTAAAEDAASQLSEDEGGDTPEEGEEDEILPGESPPRSVHSDTINVDFKEQECVHMKRGPEGFGFTLRHVLVQRQVVLTRTDPVTGLSVADNGAGPAAFVRRLSLDVNSPSGDAPMSDMHAELLVFCHSVTLGGPAALAGLRPGAQVLAVNGVEVQQMPLVEVLSAIDACETDLELTISVLEPDQLAESRGLQQQLSHLFDPESFSGAGQSNLNIFAITKQGTLVLKPVLKAAGRRNKKRQWKSYHAVLQGHVISLYSSKEQADAKGDPEGGRISVKSALCDIAYHYKKRKSVFRLVCFNGSEFLLQAENQPDMLEWITRIQSQNNPDDDSRHNHDLIKRKADAFTTAKEARASSHMASPFKSASVGDSTAKDHSTRDPQARNTPSLRQRIRGAASMKQVKAVAAKQLRRRLSGPDEPPHCNMSITDMCQKFATRLPILLLKCFREVERRAYDREGIYRLGGSHSQIQRLRDAFNKDPLSVDLSDEDKWEDVDAIAGLAKAYIRELEEPVMTSASYESFIEAVKMPADERLPVMLALVSALPPPHFSTLRMIVEHLHRISLHEEENKMSVKNIAIVFGPTLVRPGEETVASMISDMSAQCNIVEFLIDHCDAMFSGEAADPEVAIDDALPAPASSGASESSDAGGAAALEGTDGSGLAEQAGHGSSAAAADETTCEPGVEEQAEVHITKDAAAVKEALPGDEGAALNGDVGAPTGAQATPAAPESDDPVAAAAEPAPERAQASKETGSDAPRDAEAGPEDAEEPTTRDPGSTAVDVSEAAEGAGVQDARDRARWMMEEFDRLASALAKEPKGGRAARAQSDARPARRSAVPAPATSSGSPGRQRRTQSTPQHLGTSPMSPRRDAPTAPAVPVVTPMQPAVTPARPLTARKPPPPFEAAATSEPVPTVPRQPRSSKAKASRKGSRVPMDDTVGAIEFMKTRIRSGSTEDLSGPQPLRQRHASHPDLLDSVSVDSGELQPGGRSRSRSLDGGKALATAPPRAGRPGQRAKKEALAALVQNLQGPETAI